MQYVFRHHQINLADICNIGALAVNIEFALRGLETGERRALVSFSTLSCRTTSIVYWIYPEIKFATTKKAI